MTAERIFISVPGVEDLTSVAAMLRAAGASITSGRRTFAVEGPLTAGQAAAVWAMRGHVDSGTEGNRLTVVTAPACGDLRQVLDRLCPSGWSPDDYDGRYDDDQYGNDDWWREQQALQSSRAGGRRTEKQLPRSSSSQLTAASNTARINGPQGDVPEAQVERRLDGTCCGGGGPWAPKEGSPLVGGCQLCPRSASYWRATAAV